MREFITYQIQMLKDEIEYYNELIETAKNDKMNHEHPSIASDNYYDRKISYAEYHLFSSLSELNRLENKLNKSRILK